MCMCVTFLPPGEQVSGGGVLVMFKGLEPQLEGEEPRILIERHVVAAVILTHNLQHNRTTRNTKYQQPKISDLHATHF